MKILFKLLAVIVFLILITVTANTFGVKVLESKLENSQSIIEIIIFLLRFTSAIFPALPGSAYGILAGSLLGIKKGLIIIFFADLISCLTCFYVSKRFGRQIVKRIVGHKFLRKFESFNEKYIINNFKLTTLLLMTGFHDFFSYGMGLTSMKYKLYLPSLIMSTSVTTPILVLIGSGIIAGNLLGYFIACLLIFTIFLGRNKVEVLIRKIPKKL